MEPDQALAQLKDYCDVAESSLLASGNPNEPSDRAQGIRVKMYIVAVHAAMEECVEQYAIWLLSRVEDEWHRGRILLGAVGLVQFESSEIRGWEAGVDGFYVLMSKRIQAAKKSMSIKVHHNHGASVKYVRSLLLPLGVEFDSSLKSASVDDLAVKRGRYAHASSVAAVVVPSQKDAKQLVRDCVEYASDLCLRVKRAGEVPGK